MGDKPKNEDAQRVVKKSGRPSKWKPEEVAFLVERAPGRASMKAIYAHLPRHSQASVKTKFQKIRKDMGLTRTIRRGKGMALKADDPGTNDTELFDRIQDARKGSEKLLRATVRYFETRQSSHG